MRTSPGELQLETLGELRGAYGATTLVPGYDGERYILFHRLRYHPSLFRRDLSKVRVGRKIGDDVPMLSTFRESDTFSPFRVVRAMRTVVEARGLIDPYPLEPMEADYRQGLEQRQEQLAATLAPVITEYDATNDMWSMVAEARVTIEDLRSEVGLLQSVVPELAARI